MRFRDARLVGIRRTRHTLQEICETDSNVKSEKSIMD